jgi:hypothetical protein
MTSEPGRGGGVGKTKPCFTIRSYPIDLEWRLLADFTFEPLIFFVIKADS